MSGGVHLRGEVGELWRFGCKAGLVFRWRLDGWELDWELQAERYKLDKLLLGDGRREIDLILVVANVEVRAANGTIWTEFVADGHTHPAIVIKGKKDLKCHPREGRWPKVVLRS